MEKNCPNCGMLCEVSQDASGRVIGYCDPAVEKDGKKGCDFSFVIDKGKQKSSGDGKGLFVKITEDLSWHEKRIAELEKSLTGKAQDKPFIPWC